MRVPRAPTRTDFNSPTAIIRQSFRGEIPSRSAASGTVSSRFGGVIDAIAIGTSPLGRANIRRATQRTYGTFCE
jgi:hypothetical protein